MKYTLRVFAAFAVIGLFTTSMVVRAQDGPDILTEQQRTVIINNCADLQATINRIHQNDALTRHDRGLVYRSLADKLMAPLNQRIASNQLDGSALVQITADYNVLYQDFYAKYREYELAMRDVMQISCSTQPTQFYDAINIAHEKRLAVSEASKQLTALAEQYYKDFLIFRETVTTKKATE